MERAYQFLSLYQKHRFTDQLAFYSIRIEDFQRAARQVVYLISILLVLTMLGGILASLDILGARRFWISTSIICSILSTAAAGFGALYAFDRHAKLYQDAIHALVQAKKTAPSEMPLEMIDKEYGEALGKYVAQVEGIFKREQGQWGQLISEIEPAEITEV